MYHIMPLFIMFILFYIFGCLLFYSRYKAIHPVLRSLLLLSIAGVGAFHLTAPRNYTAFTKEIEVVYSIPSNGTVAYYHIEIVEKSNNSVVESIRVPAAEGESLIITS